MSVPSAEEEMKQQQQRRTQRGEQQQRQPEQHQPRRRERQEPQQQHPKQRQHFRQPAQWQQQHQDEGKQAIRWPRRQEEPLPRTMPRQQQQTAEESEQKPIPILWKNPSDLAPDKDFPRQQNHLSPGSGNPPSRPSGPSPPPQSSSPSSSRSRFGGWGSFADAPPVEEKDGRGLDWSEDPTRVQMSAMDEAFQQSADRWRNQQQQQQQDTRFVRIKGHGTRDDPGFNDFPTSQVGCRSLSSSQSGRRGALHSAAEGPCGKVCSASNIVSYPSIQSRLI